MSWVRSLQYQSASIYQQKLLTSCRSHSGSHSRLSELPHLVWLTSQNAFLKTQTVSLSACPLKTPKCHKMKKKLIETSNPKLEVWGMVIWSNNFKNGINLGQGMIFLSPSRHEESLLSAFFQNLEYITIWNVNFSTLVTVNHYHWIQMSKILFFVSA